LSASLIFTSPPSRDFTVIIDPSSETISPRTRTGLSCANAAPVTVAATNAAATDDSLMQALMASSLAAAYDAACGRNTAARAIFQRPTIIILENQRGRNLDNPP